MLIRKIKRFEEIPKFYAPFKERMCQDDLLVTFLGLNIIFYFAVEFYRCLFGVLHLERVHRRFERDHLEKENQKLRHEARELNSELWSYKRRLALKEQEYRKLKGEI